MTAPYSYKRLRLMSDRRLRVLQFAAFCILKESVDLNLALMQRDIVRVLQERNARIFGDECLLNVKSDPRWKLADNRRVKC